MILKNKSDYEYYAKKLRRHPEFSQLSDKYINQLIQSAD